MGPLRAALHLEGFDSEDLALLSGSISRIEDRKRNLGKEADELIELPENASPEAFTAIQDNARREYYRVMADEYNRIFRALDSEKVRTLKVVIRRECKSMTVYSNNEETERKVVQDWMALEARIGGENR